MQPSTTSSAGLQPSILPPPPSSRHVYYLHSYMLLLMTMMLMMMMLTMTMLMTMVMMVMMMMIMKMLFIQMIELWGGWPLFQQLLTEVSAVANKVARVMWR